MRLDGRRIAALGALLILPAAASWAPARPQQGEAFPPPARSLFDERLAQLRIASVAWDNRLGPRRQVVDQVCLVPDLPTFLEAIAAWDEGHYFPVLIDDPETDLRFLRAFRPARVVRMPASAVAIPEDELWGRVVEAVGRAWDAEGGDDPPPGDRVPDRLGPTPPGVVVASPTSPTLAGAVALAAGRFQPLVRWEPGKARGPAIPAEEAARLLLGLEDRISEVVPKYRGLGDDCDFVTLAGDWPDRYVMSEGRYKGDAAFDDVVARDLSNQRRWGFAGRLLGDPAESAYQAMCSLFLQPESAVLFNGYPEEEAAWSDYAMREAGRRLEPLLPVVQAAGPKEADLAGWHRTFDPINRHGLVMVNSRNARSDLFSLLGGAGKTADVPMSVPAAVVMIHSFSAAAPWDRGTVAGRWLANGAFAYYGSLNEPYLNAFRAPALVASLLAEGLPISAAVRKLPGEDAFGAPWRLHLLGDPLWRLDPQAARRPRLAGWVATESWPAYAERPIPPAGASDADRLIWCLQAALVRAARLDGGEARRAWEGELLAVRRDALSGRLREVYDDLLADLVTFARRGTPWLARVEAIPEAQRSDALARAIETREALGVDRKPDAGARRR